MRQWTIIVEFETVEGRFDEFAAIMRDHARRTRAEEPGCLRFEVIRPVERDGAPIPNRLIVNELYEDEKAVAAHEANPRLAALRATIASMLVSRRQIWATALDEEAEQEGLTPDELNASNDD